MKLNKFVSIKGIIHCKTGLRIGGTKEGVAEPGATDNPIIRHPITSLPYVPGSSLKGKMRSLLELDPATMATVLQGKPCACGGCIVCKTFGSHGMRNKEITRILVRDSELTDGSKKTLTEAQEQKGLYFSEIKSENIINRDTGVAADRGLRTQERVPAGTEFNMNLIIKIFEGDDKDKILGLVKKGLDLLQKDYLGSSGSRGYGQVEIKGLQIEELPV